MSTILRPTVQTAPLPVEAIAPLDAIQRNLSLSNARVVAIASPRAGIATSAICTMLCRSLAASDIRTLLIDASSIDADGEPAASKPADGWAPGLAIAGGLIEADHMRLGFDRFRIRTTPQTRPLFNNLHRLQQTLRHDLEAYQAIIINLPPVLDTDSTVVSTISVARAADSVFLACATGRTSASDASRCAELMKGANITLTGTILDSTDRVLPGQELARHIDKTRLLPGFLRRPLARLLRNSVLFNA